MKKKLLFIFIAILSLTMTVNAKEVTSDLKLTEDITTGIHIPEGKEVVLDLNNHKISGVIDNYATIYNEGTLTIKGNGEVSNDYNEVTDPSLILNKGTIIIENGKYTGGAYNLLNEGKATIKGGSFTRTGGTTIAIQNNKTLSITNITVQGQVISNNSITIKDGTFNAGVRITKKGTIKGGNFKVLLIAEGDNTEVLIEDATVSTLASSTNAILNVENAKVSGQVQAISNGVVNILDGEYNGALTLRGSESKINAKGGVYKYNVSRDYLEEGVVCRQRQDKMYIVLDPNNISLKMIKSSLDNLEDEEEELVNNILKEDYQIGKSYDVIIQEVTDKGEELGTVSETEEELEVTLEIPKELQNVPEDTEREFVIIRVHEGVAQELDTTNNNDGTLTAKSNLFSTYTVAYKDTKVENSSNDNTSTNTINKREEDKITNPKTKDNILLFVTILSISSTLLLINTKKLIKNN